LTETDDALCIKKALRMTAFIKEAYTKNGFSCAISPNFVTWYAAKSAYEYGPKGLRFLPD